MSVPRCSFLLAGAVALALAACNSPEPGGPATAPAGAGNAPSADALQAMPAGTPEEMAAEGTAAGRAMAETCGFTPAEIERFIARENTEGRGPGFEARVQAHLPRLREAQQAQRRENSAAYDENCEFLRFMGDNRD